MKNTTLILVVFTLVLASCSKGTVSSVSEQPTDLSPKKDDTAAATLYAAKCASCHELQPREKYTANQWKRIVPEMAKLAKINSDQEAQILQFVLLSSKPE